MRKLKEELTKIAPSGKIFFSDCDHYDPMTHLCDGFVHLPPVTDTAFRTNLISAITAHSITHIIPWLDPDITFLSRMRAELEQHRCKLMAPESDVIELFNDKLRTASWLRKNRLPHPKTILANANLTVSEVVDVLGQNIVVKPRFGQGSVGVEYINGPKELSEWFTKTKTDYLLQERVSGTEYTVDVLQQGNIVLGSCPRIRMKTRGGEALIAKTMLEPDILEIAQKIASAVTTNSVYNFQVMRNHNSLSIIEFNPRFGGGSDLSIAAGLNIPLFMFSMYAGIPKKLPTTFDVKNNLVMTRYHESHFFLDDILR